MKHLALPLLLSLAMLTGCAIAPPQSAAPPPALFADAAFAPPAEPVGAADLFTLSPAMRAYLRSPAFGALLRTRGLEQGLVEALYSKNALRLDYDASVTRTAAETYAARTGNCLSLVIMTAAFARELNMTVRFQSVDVDETWSRDGSLYLVAAHVNIALGHRKARDLAFDDGAERELVVDFLPPPDAARLRTRQLDEAEITALFMNNRAAEALVRGRIDDAYWWARAAVNTNPANAIVYNTLAVIYQRHGQVALAERAYRAALQRDPDNLVTLQNLGPLLARLGRFEEAQALARRAASIQPTPPFYYFDQGLAAMKRGDYDGARSLFEREVERAPYNDEFHFWLALAHLRLGDTAQARAQLARAVATSTRRDMRDAYSAKLAHLRQYRQADQ
jgi:Tfp pilus assembly protein PilF